VRARERERERERERGRASSRRVLKCRVCAHVGILSISDKTNTCPTCTKAPGSKLRQAQVCLVMFHLCSSGTQTADHAAAAGRRPRKVNLILCVPTAFPGRRSQEGSSGYAETPLSLSRVMGETWGIFEKQLAPACHPADASPRGLRSESKSSEL